MKLFYLLIVFYALGFSIKPNEDVSNNNFQTMAWEVNFFSLDTSFYNPLREDGLFSPMVRMAPFKTDKVTKLDYKWRGGIKTDIVHKQFITVAEANTKFLPGKYELSVTWNDAVRVYVDEKLILNEWKPAKIKLNNSPTRKVKIKLGGLHHFRVEHLELGGFATLSLKLRRL